MHFVWFYIQMFCHVHTGTEPVGSSFVLRQELYTLKCSTVYLLLIEHGFTYAPTQYRLYGRRFLLTN